MRLCDADDASSVRVFGVWVMLVMLPWSLWSWPSLRLSPCDAGDASSVRVFRVWVMLVMLRVWVMLRVFGVWVMMLPGLSCFGIPSNVLPSCVYRCLSFG